MKRNTVEIIPSAGDISVGKIDFSELRANGTNFVRLQPPDAIATSVLLTLPDALPPTAGEALVSDLAGNLSFAPMGGSGVFATDVQITTAGDGLAVKGGLNAKIGIANLAAGVVTVNTTAVTANSRIFVNAQNYPGGGLGAIDVRNIVPGVSFDIYSTSNLDIRAVAWFIVEQL